MKPVQDFPVGFTPRLDRGVQSKSGARTLTGRKERYRPTDQTAGGLWPDKSK
jgi:hypothetical protein